MVFILLTPYKIGCVRKVLTVLILTETKQIIPNIPFEIREYKRMVTEIRWLLISEIKWEYIDSSTIIQ